VGTTIDNVTYAVGAVFFTAAAFIALRLSGRWHRGAWRSRAAWDDWWAAAIQLVGTVCFNVTTIAALSTHLTPIQADRRVWAPDAVGSACFLVASALAILATVHRDRLWDPDARSWWTAWLNMAGSVAFAASAVASFVVPSTGNLVDDTVTNAGTFVGALCFLAGALLMRPSAEDPAPEDQTETVTGNVRIHATVPRNSA
jgi:drug/metabolite transporter (DMT)-like permease